MRWVVEGEEEFSCGRFLCAENDASVSADPLSTLGNKEMRRHLIDVSIVTRVFCRCYSSTLPYVRGLVIVVLCDDTF